MLYFFMLEPEEQDESVYSAIAGGDSGSLKAVFRPSCRAVHINNLCT